MSSQLIYEAITNISDHYIEEADPEAGNGWRTQIRRIRPILNMAAVLLVVVGISAVAIDLGLFGRAKSEAPAADAAVAEYSLQMEAAYDAPAADAPAADAPAESEEAVLFRSELTEEAAPVPEPSLECESDVAEDNDLAESTEMDTLDTPAAGFDISLLIEEGYPEEVSMNGDTYYLQAVLLTELPEGCSTADLSALEVESELPSDLNAMVSEALDCLYLSYGDSWIVYQK